MQSTALDHGQIMLTTLLVHASGEWVSSLWPVCPASETSAHVKGAALTYARRYALFTLVGIAGEDDLDAPDIPHKEQPSPGRAPPQKGSNGSVHAPPTRDVAGSAALRDRLLQEIAGTVGEEALAVWAKRAMPLKNQLSRRRCPSRGGGLSGQGERQLRRSNGRSRPGSPRRPPTSPCDIARKSPRCKSR